MSSPTKRIFCIVITGLITGAIVALIEDRFIPFMMDDKHLLPSAIAGISATFTAVLLIPFILSFFITIGRNNIAFFSVVLATVFYVLYTFYPGQYVYEMTQTLFCSDGTRCGRNDLINLALLFCIGIFINALAYRISQSIQRTSKSKITTSPHS